MMCLLAGMGATSATYAQVNAEFVREIPDGGHITAMTHAEECVAIVSGVTY